MEKQHKSLESQLLELIEENQSLHDKINQLEKQIMEDGAKFMILLYIFLSIIVLAGIVLVMGWV